MLTSNATLGTHTLVNAGQDNSFVAKLNAAGVWEWAIAVGGVHVDLIHALALDGSGNVYVYGEYTSPSLAFGSTVLPDPAGDNGLFVAKLDPTGAWQWAVPISGPNMVRSGGLAVDATDNVYVAGLFDSPSLTIGSTTLTNAGGSANSDVFVAKLSSLGAWQWAVSGGSSSA
ncbi:MAG TPA: hypothetical protein VEI97_03110, partial [bacterium]|nr:hypothetical protein [bacterium]